MGIWNQTFSFRLYAEVLLPLTILTLFIPREGMSLVLLSSLLGLEPSWLWWGVPCWRHPAQEGSLPPGIPCPNPPAAKSTCERDFERLTELSHILPKRWMAGAVFILWFVQDTPVTVKYVVKVMAVYSMKSSQCCWLCTVLRWHL